MRPCPSCDATIVEPIWTDGGYELVRCAGCDLVFVWNPPTPEHLGDLYSFKLGYHVDMRDDANQIAFRERLGRGQIADLGRHVPPGKLVDVGASAGFFVKAAVDQGWDALGVELSPDTSSLAAERYGINMTCGTLDDVRVDPGSLDAITMWDVLEHVLEPRRELQRAAELVRAGGVLAVSTPNIDGWYPRASFHVRHMLGMWRVVEPPYHLTQFSVRTLSHLLAQTGWRVVDVRHSWQGLNYSFGNRDQLRRSPLRAMYALVFAPISKLGAMCRAGDQITVFARRQP